MKTQNSITALPGDPPSELALAAPHAKPSSDPAERRKRRCQAFTLTELIVVIAAVVLLGSISLTAMSSSKDSVQAVTCVDNVQQLTRAWKMYAADNHGNLVGNGEEGNQSEAQWAVGALSYGADNRDNTNINNFVRFQPSAGYHGGQLGNYLDRDYRVFKCPSDPVLSLVGGQKYPRVRSVSMNGWVGASWGLQWDSGGVVAHRITDIINPGPSDTWIFHDERPDSINDGYFVVSMTSTMSPDMPASYHFGGSANAYADGHAEIHLWKTAPFSRQDVNAPNWQQTYGGGAFPNNVDRGWIQSHSGQFSRSFIAIP